MNSENTSTTAAKHSGDSIRLEVQGIGPVISLKNGKLLTRGKLITDPKKQKWMDQCVQLLFSQLDSAFPTTGPRTSTTLLSPCATLSREQLRSFDDRWQIVRELHITAEKCEKGQEGATITIERL